MWKYTLNAWILCNDFSNNILGFENGDVDFSLKFPVKQHLHILGNQNGKIPNNEVAYTKIIHGCL